MGTCFACVGACPGGHEEGAKTTAIVNVGQEDTSGAIWVFVFGLNRRWVMGVE